MARLFISSTYLESLTAQGQATVEGTRLILPSMGQAFLIKEGVRFASMVTTDLDIPELIGRVKDKTELIDMGAEHEGSTVILGELGYNVDEGFVGIPVK